MDISYSEMAGELRKASKLFKVFEKAAEAATVLADYEKEEQKILKNISNLNAEKDGLDKKCEDAAQRKIDAEKSIVEAKEKEVEILEQAQQNAKVIIVNAESKGADILATANSELQAIKRKIVDAENVAQTSISNRNDALKALDAVEKQMKSTKDRFLKTLEQ